MQGFEQVPGMPVLGGFVPEVTAAEQLHDERGPCAVAHDVHQQEHQGAVGPALFHEERFARNEVIDLGHGVPGPFQPAGPCAAAAG